MTMASDPEMRLSCNFDDEVVILCTREGCRVDSFWLEIPLPFDATPMIVERMWMEHRLAHANLEK